MSGKREAIPARCFKKYPTRNFYPMILITGAGSGLGRAAALQFARAGKHVIVSDMQQAAGAETVALIQKEGGTADFIACNVAVEAEVNALLREVARRGRLEAAVNNAGIGGKGLTPVHQYDLATYEQVMAVNATGVFLCMKAELEVFLEQGGAGAIVNVASAAGLIGMPQNVAYTASKHAVVGMTRTAALEYARKNIRINAVCPAFTSTPMVDELIALHHSMEEKLIQSIPMKRLGRPEEIAEAIVWLCSEKASFVNGHALALDGGLTAG